MNVLYVANSTELYGANMSLLDMLERLQDMDVNPVVLTMRYGGLKRELDKRKIKCYVIPYYTNVEKEGNGNLLKKTDKLIANIFCIPRATEIIKRHHIDIIHTNASNIDFGAMLAIKNHIPHVWHVREMLYEHYHFTYDFPFLSKFLLHKADRIIAISEFVKNGKKLNGNTSVIYNGFNLEKYSIHKQHLFEDDTIYILYCGIVCESKGVMDIVQAVHFLVEKGYHNIRLSIVGSGDEYWKKLKEFIDMHELGNYINYCGYQSDMRSFREKADIAVVSSRNEALGRVTIESMLGDVLVIGAKSGATSELILDGVTGYLYEPGDSRALAEQIIDVQHNSDKGIEIVHNAKEYALKNFDSGKYAVQILEIYNQCLSRKLGDKE